jgi:hypothetical protein
MSENGTPEPAKLEFAPKGSKLVIQPPTGPEPPPKPNLLQKLAEVVAEIDNVEKRGRNEFQKYAYVKAADVAWLVRKALSSRNVYLVADVVEVRNYEIPAREGHMQAVDIKMQFSFFDGDAPEVPPIVLHSLGTGTDKGDKAVYKAMTGALKYGLRHAFLIPDESDPEADVETDKATANAKAVGEAKVAELKKKATKPEPQKCLFFVLPEAFNGNTAELVNVKAFGETLNEVAAEGLRVILKKYVRLGKQNNELYLNSERLPMLMDELKECGVELRELQAP